MEQFHDPVETDYTLHKLRLAKHRELEKSGSTDEFDRDEQDDEPVRPGTSGQSSNKSSSELSSTLQQRKGILKPPTVRFKEDDRIELEHPAPLFLPPRPGPDGKPLSTPMTVLHDKMPELPPGEPMGLNPFASGVMGAAAIPRIDPGAYKVYERFMDGLSEFVSMQENVVRSRVMVQEKRTSLRFLRERVSKADIEFMDYLRQCKAMGTVSEDPKLEALFEVAQQARDLVGPEEVDYEAIEIKLGADESALAQKYEELEQHFEKFFKLGLATSTDNTIPSTILFEAPSDVTGTDEQQPYEKEPRQYSRFQGALIGDRVKVGQLPLVGSGSDGGDSLADADPAQPKKGPSVDVHHDSHANIINPPSASIESNAPANTRAVGVRETFQAGSGSAEMEQSGIVPEFESGDLRIRFSLQGLDPIPFRKSTVHFVDDPDLELPPYESTEGFLHGVHLPPIQEVPERLLDDLSMDFSGSLGDGDSLLLLGTDSDTQSTLSDYLTSFESTTDRVNKWLLHKLRVSPLEVLELQRRIQSSPTTVPDWANLALKLWNGDIFDQMKGRDLSPNPYSSTEGLAQRLRLGNNRRGRLVQAGDEPGF